MPDRRPYASRGVPRRATTRWSGRRTPRWSRVGLGSLGGFALLAVAVACVVSRPLTPMEAAVAPVPVGQSAASGSAQPGDPAAATADPGASAPAVATQVAAAALTPRPTLRAWDASVPGITNDPLLASRLDQALVGVDGHIGVAVKDLGSGRGAVLNGDLELQSASLYKLPILYTVFDLGLNLSEELTITDEALSYDSGTMELGPGETLTVAEALERMVTLSDNTSAILLGSRVGAGNIDASIAALGMDTTHYSLERMTSSALDMLHFVELVARGKAVSPGASADILHLMLRQR